MNWRVLAVLLGLSALPASAQMLGFEKPQILKYTAQNPYPRGEDGRPVVPDYWLDRLRTAASTTAWEALSRAGYPHQWEGGWQNPHPEKKLIGRVFTARFMPSRPDVEDVIEADAAAEGLEKATTPRVINMLQPGDVLVVDIMGRIEEGQFGGDNLIYALFIASGNGFVVDGSFRDLDGVFEQNTPVFSRGYHPGVRGSAMLVGVNVPIRIGETTVMPGDVVLGDRMGVTFIPPHLVQEVVKHAEASQKKE